MDTVRSIFDNAVVQVLIGVGILVFIISLGEGISKWMSSKRPSKQLEERIAKAARSEVESLREEMKQLKATLLEHSMSLDRNVEGLARRVERIEQSTNVRSG